MYRQKLKNSVRNVLLAYDYISFDTHMLIFSKRIFKTTFRPFSCQNRPEVGKNLKIVSETPKWAWSGKNSVRNVISAYDCKGFDTHMLVLSKRIFQADLRSKSAWSRQKLKIVSETSFPHMIRLVLTSLCWYFQKKYFRPLLGSFQAKIGLK